MSIVDVTISAIDVAEEDPTKAVLTTFTYNDNQPGDGYNLIAISPDGKKLYITNLRENSVTTATLV